MADRLILGCGYLGRRLASGWLAAGERVWATTRSPARANQLRQLGLEPVVADVLQPESLHALPDASTVVFCVGLDRSSGHTLGDIHVTGLGNVLAELDRSKRSAGGRFLYVSSTSVYGQADGGEVDETAATEPTEEGGKVMCAAERLLRERRPDAIVLRFAGIYGPGRLIGARALQEGIALVGSADSWLNLIHVEDGAAAVEAAAERGRPGTTYNVSDGRPVRRGDFYGRLAQLLGFGPPVFHPTPPHGQANRRIVSRLLHEELGLVPRYPSYVEGLAAAVGGLRPPDSGSALRRD
jgi:nucleoside-diphosphate-sugar epimerase